MRRISMTVTAAFALALLPACEAGEDEGADTAVEERESEGGGEEGEED